MWKRRDTDSATLYWFDFQLGGVEACLVVPTSFVRRNDDQSTSNYRGLLTALILGFSRDLIEADSLDHLKDKAFELMRKRAVEVQQAIKELAAATSTEAPATPKFCLRYRDSYLSEDYGPTKNPSEIMFFHKLEWAEKCHFALTDSAHYFTQVCKNFGDAVKFNEFKIVQYTGHGSDEKVPA